jgi:hypothetical protein
MIEQPGVMDRFGSFISPIVFAASLPLGSKNAGFALPWNSLPAIVGPSKDRKDGQSDRPQGRQFARQVTRRSGL